MRHADSAHMSNLWSRFDPGGEYAARYITGGDPFVLANTVALVPFGFLLTLASRRVWVSLLTAAALVLCIEALQALAHADGLHDVIANTAGATVGAVAGGAYHRYRRRRATP